jgi:hypothetical protein
MNRSNLNKAYTSNGRNKFALKYEPNHLAITNKERFVQGQYIVSQEKVNKAVPIVSNQVYKYTIVKYSNTVRVCVRMCTVQVYGDQSERTLQRKQCIVMVCERVLNTKKVLTSTGDINNGKKWHVSEKCTKVTESDKMSIQPIVDQEMKDLERKDGKITVTPPGKCARVLSLRVQEKIRILGDIYWCNISPPGMYARFLRPRDQEKKWMLSDTFWSNKSHKVCVQSGNWHREYGE